MMVKLEEFIFLMWIALKKQKKLTETDPLIQSGGLVMELHL